MPEYPRDDNITWTSSPPVSAGEVIKPFLNEHMAIPPTTDDEQPTGASPRENPGPVNAPAFDRVRDFIIEAARSGRPPVGDWQGVLGDVALDLDKIVYGIFAHPDSVGNAATAMSTLAGVWLTDDEKDALDLNTEEPRQP